MSRTPVVRKTYLVDSVFQLKYTFLLVGVGALVSALFGTMMYLTHLDARRVLELAAPQDELLQMTLRESERTLLWLVVGTTALMGVALGLFGVLFTHRVAGPLFVMARYLGVVESGRLPQVRPLRKTDELQSFFDRFQRTLDALRQKEADEADALEAIAGLLAAPANPEATERLRALAAKKRATLEPPPKA